MTNIRDIAKKSGYSASTVSRFLNQTGYVSQSAKQAIQQVIDELDYVPNALARDLSKGKSNTIGIVIPQMQHPFFTELINGIMDTAFAADYHVSVLESRYDEQLEEKYLEKLHRKAFDALIFTSHKLPLARLAAYQKYGPVICCEDPGVTPIAAAYVLRKKTYVAAFNWIKKNRYSKIAINLSRPYQLSATSKVTLQAYRDVFETFPDDQLIFEGVDSHPVAYQAASRIAQIHPDFIFGNIDDVIAGVYQYYIDNQLKLPKMMGQENQISGKLLKIPTIDHHLRQLGQAAGRLAISGDVRQIAIESDLIIR
ncbi:LacI family DNA-binding transcriptional regulator [Pediococcus acidilactici]|uniref:Sugar-binding domain protein n=1 Tax=Pediococcus acidilactici DSM 20284 TaxID=862514 RepID=E0NDM4_PEDAC|nr:LacI family DNA-binding transcriptional regulator [Pediococcus acidilactici]AZP90717.1 LacI family DNA-binding transcriptional regulator [Pediococcus acidilactici]EFL96345.1 sugar-binding domain protein [Pediococcus acidilactici DSM 20284]MDG9739693.1 LacI family DNA-binding transcriptional regulator [Pediococcus acidilactici]NKZ16173.1 LacI family DNA-binding transcriptional regulator [Pediococcus acidilactici]QQT96157.1 LacI family DNA-binding transcriptional regulator [Pediococcus acidil